MKNKFLHLLNHLSRIKLGTKLVSMILALVMAFFVVPTVIYAEAADALSEIGSSDSEAEVTAPESNSDIYELTDRRGENYKTFRLEDGSFMAAQYPMAIHRQDAKGVWQDIDNTLSVSGSEISTPDARVKFAKKITGNETLFTLHDGNAKITFSLDGAIKKTKGEIIDISEEPADSSELGKLMHLDKISSKIIYKDILDGVDVEYIVTGNDIKENIIVKEKKESYVYSFDLKLNNLTAALAESGDVIISDKNGNVSYVIPAPEIFDANGESAPQNTGVYSLSELGNGSYAFSVTVSSEWMNAENRAYPVTVDPTVSTLDTYMVDITIRETSPNTVYSTQTSLSIGKGRASFGNISLEGPVYTEIVSLWKLTNLSCIPDNAYIVDAKLGLYAATRGNVTVGAYVSNYDWTENSTYNSIGFDPTELGEVISYQKVQTTDTSTAPYYFDITSAVRAWDSDSTSNKGIILRSIAQSGIATVGFYSANASELYRPQFTVTYTKQTGLEDYYSYSSHGIGATTGSVNLSTGNLVLTIPTISTPDGLASYVPTLYYNTAIANQYSISSNTGVAFLQPAASAGFNWSMRQSVVKKTYTNMYGASISYYVWFDADGTEHAFTEMQSDGSYKDEDGMKLTLTPGTSTLTIKDINDTVMSFVAEASGVGTSYTAANSWVLEKVTDSVGNSIIFEYDEAYRPTEIVLKPNGANETTMLIFAYGVGSLPAAVYNPHTRDGVVFKYSATYNASVDPYAGQYLREIIYVSCSLDTSGMGIASENDLLNFQSGMSVPILNIKEHIKITYTNEGYVSAVTEALSNQKIEYGTTGNKLSSVTEYAGNVMGQKIEFNYYAKYTEATASGGDDTYGTSDDIVTRYTFDKYGRCVSDYSQDKNGELIYNATVVSFETQDNVRNNVSKISSFGGSSANYVANGDFEDVSSGSFLYWEKTSNVSSCASPNYDGIKGVLFDLEANRTETLSQYLYLPSGKYTLSFDIESYDTEGCTFNVSGASILGGSSLRFSENIELDKYSETLVERPAVFFEIPNIASNGGDKIKLTFTASGSNTASAHASVKIDCVMLEDGIGASGFNMVEIGGFEESVLNSGGNAIVSPKTVWEYTGDDLKYEASSANPVFGRAAMVYADINREMYIKQRIYEADLALLSSFGGSEFASNTDSYILSGYAKGSAAIQSDISKFRIRVVVAYYQGSGASDRVVTYEFDFAPYCSEWQFTGGSFSTAINLGDGYDYECVRYIDVYCDYSYQPGSYAYFDNVSVTPCRDDSVVEYEYYEGTGLLKSKKEVFYYESYEYDVNNNLKKIQNNRGEMFEFTYNANKTVSSEVYYAKIDGVQKRIRRTDYTYNSFGQQTQTTTHEYNLNTQELDISRSITEKKTYYSGGFVTGKLYREEDALGNVTEYLYDMSGKLDYVYNVSSGDGYKYFYDATDRLHAVYPASYEPIISYDTTIEKVLYFYDSANRPIQISTGGSAYYQLSYDGFGNVTNVKENAATIVSYTYNSYNGKLASIAYSNGLTESYTYDALDRLSEIYYNGVKRYSYTYTSKGEVHSIENHSSGEITTYTYDASGKLTQVASSKGGYNEVGTSFSYDSNGRLSSVWNRISYLNGTSSAAFGNQYFYTSDGKLSEEIIRIVGDYNRGISYTYDNFNRLSGTSLNISSTNINSSYTYTEANGKLSGQIASNTVSVNGSVSASYTYSYDAKGNITSIVYGTGMRVDYTYDNLGQLIREDNEPLQYTHIFEYDNDGNMTAKRMYPYTRGDVSSLTPVVNSSTYANGNRLATYNGEAITYDGIGNPISYYHGKTFTWQGRRLVGFARYGTTYSYTYNDEGLRTSQTIGGAVTTEYYYSGNLLIGEKTGNEIILYARDASGSPIGFQYHGATYANDQWDVYWYEKNVQGDIVAVYNSAGTKLISYGYDAWGAFAVVYYNGGENTSAIRNPFRYRGYYYDENLGCYYLNSRYYDPNTGRFVSQDSLGYLGANGDLISYNLYAYCSNNPVMYVDPDGNFIISLSALLMGVVIGAAVGAGVSFGVTAYQDYSDDGKIFNGSIGVDEYLGNAAGGLIAGAGVGVCTVLGAAAGTAVFTGSAATLFASSGIGITINSALGIGITTSFATGVAGYALKTAISSKETFNTNLMFYEGGMNAISGALSVFGGYIGGLSGLRIDLASKLLSRKSDIVKRLVIQNIFSGTAKIFINKNGGIR